MKKVKTINSDLLMKLLKKDKKKEKKLSKKEPELDIYKLKIDKFYTAVEK